MNRSIITQINDHQNDIGRFICQIRSALIAISIEDNLDTLSDECMMNVLWLVQDRINDLEKANEDQYKVIRKEFSSDEELLLGSGAEAFTFSPES